MKRLAIVFAGLFVFSISAEAQMGGMIPGPKGETKQQGMMGEGEMPMMPMCEQMMQKMMGEGQQMPMCEQMMQKMMGYDMMLDMMNMQEKMMMAPNADEKKQMMKDMAQMKEKMQQMMSMHMGTMMRQSLQAKLKCAEQWLKKAIDLHEVHIKDPKTATEASQMEMMEQMENAYKCITTGLETTETPVKVHEGEKTKREDSPKTEQHEHSH